jgi:hypothetical protein
MFCGLSIKLRIIPLKQSVTNSIENTLSNGLVVMQTIACCYENNCLASRYNGNASALCLGSDSSIPAFRRFVTIPYIPKPRLQSRTQMWQYLWTWKLLKNNNNQRDLGLVMCIYCFDKCVIVSSVSVKTVRTDFRWWNWLSCIKLAWSDNVSLFNGRALKTVMATIRIFLQLYIYTVYIRLDKTPGVYQSKFIPTLYSEIWFYNIIPSKLYYD